MAGQQEPSLPAWQRFRRLDFRHPGPRSDSAVVDHLEGLAVQIVNEKYGGPTETAIQRALRSLPDVVKTIFILFLLLCLRTTRSLRTLFEDHKPVKNRGVGRRGFNAFLGRAAGTRWAHNDVVARLPVVAGVAILCWSDSCMASSRRFDLFHVAGRC